MYFSRKAEYTPNKLFLITTKRGTMSTTTIRTFLGFTLSILFIWLPSLFAGLAPNTKITTPTNMVCVESLKVGNTICGYGPTSHSFPDVKIKNIQPVPVESIYVITTKHGTITASTDQLFYEITSQNFIPAAQLKPGHLFLTKDIKALECISVKHKNTQTTVYDLTLEEPHLFFSSNAQILTHNAIHVVLVGLPIVAPPVIKFVASVGAIAAALYVEKVTTSALPIFAQCRKRRERKAARQALLASLNQNQAEGHPTPDNKSQTSLPPVIGGGPKPDPNDPKKKDEENQRNSERKECMHKDVTRGPSIRNVETDVTKEEFEKSLKEDGWIHSKSKDGKIDIYDKGNSRYAVRDFSKSTQGPTAEHYINGNRSPESKIRLK